MKNSAEIIKSTKISGNSYISCIKLLTERIKEMERKIKI
jgi:hypothetical protein